MHNLPIGNLLIREIDAGVDELIGQKSSPTKVAAGLQDRLQGELQIRLAHVQRRALAEHSSLTPRKKLAVEEPTGAVEATQSRNVRPR
jgi:hypothetical protein